MKVKLSQVKENEMNPRFIRDDNFKKLVKSIQEFPEMLSVRKLVVNKDMVVLGGNMRLKALKEAGIKEVEVEVVDWNEEKQREFVVKDNLGYGEWDFEMLANEWDHESLEDWGLKIPGFESVDNLEDLFDVPLQEEEKDNFKIVLEYTEEEYQKVIEAFKIHAGSKEEVVARLLGL
jgi:hypothetical protein